MLVGSDENKGGAVGQLCPKCEGKERFAFEPGSHRVTGLGRLPKTRGIFMGESLQYGRPRLGCILGDMFLGVCWSTHGKKCHFRMSCPSTQTWKPVLDLGYCPNNPLRVILRAKKKSGALPKINGLKLPCKAPCSGGGSFLGEEAV